MSWCVLLNGMNVLILWAEMCTQRVSQFLLHMSQLEFALGTAASTAHAAKAGACVANIVILGRSSSVTDESLAMISFAPFTTQRVRERSDMQTA